MRHVAIAALSLSMIVTTRSADACLYPRPEEFQSKSTTAERVPPTLDRALAGSVRRGKEPQQSGCSGAAYESCDDIGSFSVAVAGHDDVPGEIGFFFELASGNLPKGVSLPATAIRAADGLATFRFIDGADDDQESFAFTLRVFAVDAAGNRSAPRSVEISHPGTGGGCGQIAATRVSLIVPWCAALLVAALLVRRRG